MLQVNEANEGFDQRKWNNSQVNEKPNESDWLWQQEEHWNAFANNESWMTNDERWIKNDEGWMTNAEW